MLFETSRCLNTPQKQDRGLTESRWTRLWTSISAPPTRSSFYATDRDGWSLYVTLDCYRSSLSRLSDRFVQHARECEDWERKREAERRDGLKVRRQERATRLDIFLFSDDFYLNLVQHFRASYAARV